MRHFTLASVTALSLLLLSGACSSTDSEENKGGGGSSTGGSPTSDGGSENTNSGGKATTGDSGGTPSSGGSNSGGATSSCDANPGGANNSDPVSGDAGADMGGSADRTAPPNGPTNTGMADFETVRFIADQICGNSLCHGGGEQSPELVDDFELYDTLMTHQVAGCDCRTLVSPGQPEESSLLILLKGSCGEVPRMPKDCTEGESCVPQPFIDRIEQWIEDGAKK